MALVAGTFEIGPGTGPLTLHTGRTGLGSVAGHDLEIEVTRWHGKLHVDSDDTERSTVEVVIDATSFKVREGTGGAMPLLPINKSEIVRTISRVLETKKHPEIRFASTCVEPTSDGFVVSGELTIAGRSRQVQLAVQVTDDGEAPSGSISTTLLHSDFGIKPYSAMLGALKVRDAVDIRAEVRLSSVDF